MTSGKRLVRFAVRRALAAGENGDPFEPRCDRVVEHRTESVLPTPEPPHTLHHPRIAMSAHRCGEGCAFRHGLVAQLPLPPAEPLTSNVDFLINLLFVTGRTIRTRVRTPDASSSAESLRRPFSFWNTLAVLTPGMNATFIIELHDSRNPCRKDESPVSV
jgi:hypothetical protein